VGIDLYGYRSTEMFFFYRRNMESICITMVAIKREQFGDPGKMIRLKLGSRVHLAQHYTVDLK
jgi:hypothetical protein